MNPNGIGIFRGTTLLQQRGSIGGIRSVFVKLKGIKNELVYPTFGGIVKNPFKAPGKMFAGDLLEYRTNDKGVAPEIYLLKTFEVAEQVSASKTVKIKRDGFRHVPCVGDVLGVAPATMGGAISEELKVQDVKETTSESGAVWELTVDKTPTISPATVLVESDGHGHMLVKTVNAFADCDIDFLFAPSTGDEDFDGARYMYTPAIGGAKMYIHKMSKLPACALKLNTSRINGWYALPPVF